MYRVIHDQFFKNEIISLCHECKYMCVSNRFQHFRQSVNSPSPTSGSGSGNNGAAGASGPARLEQDIIESLVSEQFTAEFTLKHGFPNKPTALAFDPLQKIMAIGNRSGVVRLYGRPGVDVEFKHEKECAIFQVHTYLHK